VTAGSPVREAATGHDLVLAGRSNRSSKPC